MKHSTLLSLLLAAFVVQAQTLKPSRPAAEPIAIESEQLAWVSLRGNAIDMAVGNDGTAFTLDREGQVWMRRSGSTSWLALPGHFTRIDAASEKSAWAVDDQGGVSHYNGTYWRLIEEVKAIDVGVSTSDVAFAVLSDGSLARYDRRRDTFLPVDGAPARLSRVDVDDKDQPWVVLANGNVQRYVGTSWIKLSGPPVRDIAVGPEGAAFAISPEQQLLRWNVGNRGWTPIAARASVIAIGPDGGPWLATPDGNIFAQQPDSRPRAARTEAIAQAFTQVLNWRKVNGTAKTLSISAKGQVVALGPDGVIWQWKGRDWSRLAGKLSQVAIAPDGKLWGIDDDGKILQQQLSTWIDLPGRASDIAIGSKGVVWIVQPDGGLAQWQPDKRDWQALADDSKAPPKARRVAVDPDGRPWIISTTGTVQRHDGKRWVDYPAIDAKEIAIGPEGSVFLVADNKPWRYNLFNNRWERVTGEAAAIAVGPLGKPWAVTAQNTILATSFFEDERPTAEVTANRGGGSRTTTSSSTSTTSAAAATTPVVTTNAAPTAKDPLNLSSFLQIRNATARDIAIGNDGSVFALAFDGALIRWNNTQNKFISFPGTFSRIAVEPGGKPWGVTTGKEVWRHDGSTWRVVNNILAQDIAIGYDGTVIVAAPDESLHKFIPIENRFIRMLAAREDEAAPTGSRVAVDPKGKPWTIDKNNRLRRCDRSPCQLLPQTARDIEIGPEGSVFITDMDRKLRRYDPKTEVWEFIAGVDADVVAVGPAGKPWIVNSKSEVWYSALFKRDESRDIAAATATNTTTATAASSTSTAPVFTFLANMPFDEIVLPAGFSDGGFPPFMAFRPDGKLVAIDSQWRFWNYDESRKAWTLDTTIPSLAPALGVDAMRSFAIGKDGVYWMSNDLSMSPTTKVFRREGSQWVSVTGVDDCTPPSCTPSPSSIAVAPDGAVYATSKSNLLYRYDVTQKRFVRQTVTLPDAGISFVAIDPVGRFWGGAPSTGRLYEQVGNAWVRRDNATTGLMGACLWTGIPCVSIGANGSVYGFDTVAPPASLLRWNPTSSLWDVINTSPDITAGTYITGPDGRPWALWHSPPPGGPFRLFRAR